MNKPLIDFLPLTDNTNLLRNIEFWNARRDGNDSAIAHHVAVLVMIMQSFIK